jgi:RNA polymerase sigma-70 factor (ECF subfamily)
VIDVNVNEIDGQNGEVDSVVALIPALRAFARSFCRNPNDADDLVQETLVKAIANIDKYEEGTRLKSWLFTIMRNTFYTRIRVAKREAPGDADCVASQPIVLPTQEWTLRGQEVEAAIERLSPSHREVLILIGMHGVSYEEAAEICGCAIGTVKSRLNRARGAVLEMLGEQSAGALVESSEWLAGEASSSGRVSPR